MHIIYETNGLGFLGWITDLPGAYIRGKTLEEARGKVNKEIALCTEWLNFEKAIDMQINEEIKKSDLHIEDADSDIIFDSELIDTVMYIVQLTINIVTLLMFKTTI